MLQPHCGVYVDTVTAEPPLQSTAAAARRLAGPGWGGRRRGRGGQTTGTTGRVTTTPLAPLVQTRTGAHFIMVTGRHPADTRHYG